MPHMHVSSGHRMDSKETELYLLPSLPLCGRAASHFPFPGPHRAGVEDEEVGEERGKEKSSCFSAYCTPGSLWAISQGLHTIAP